MQLRKRLKAILVVSVMLLATLIVPVLAAGEDVAAVSRFYNTAWAFLPPVIAIVLALITKEAYSSLFIGIVVGAVLHCEFAPVATLDAVINDGLITAIADNAGIFLFLVILGTIVALVNAAGGSAAFGRWAEKNIKTRVGAMLATFVLGVLIFIDDYFNCLTVGSVMRPVTDGHKISRAKLAYLIDATAAPVCMIAPVSSWAAAVSGVAADLDTGVSGIQLFVQAIPLNFYSLLTFVFIIGMALMQLDYGPIKKHEELALQTGELGALETESTDDGNPKGKVMDLVLPVVVLIAFCVVGMIYVGGFFGVDAWGGTDCAGDFIGAFGNTDAFISLPWGALIALVLTIAYVVGRRLMTFKEAMACVPKGFIAMVPPITILTLAVSLKTMTGYLGAAEFVEAAMKGVLAPKFREALIGHAEIRQTYKVSGVGTVAGCYVQDGKIVRNCSIRLVRDGIVIHEGALASLQRFKDAAKEVASGYECGLTIEKFNDIKEGDIVEGYTMEEIPQ